jgi:hypothetical protein
MNAGVLYALEIEGEREIEIGRERKSVKELRLLASGRPSSAVRKRESEREKERKKERERERDKE